MLYNTIIRRIYDEKEKISKKKGFTLIELLAVIIILALLMAIAIPSVTKYIDQSRKKTYIQTLDSYADGFAKMVANGDIGGFTDENTVYYVPHSCINLEKGGLKSPNGDWDFAYILISVENRNLKYYAYAKDIKGFGVEGIEVFKLKTSDIKQTNIKKEDLITIDGKGSTAVVPDTCNFNQMLVNSDSSTLADECFDVSADGRIDDFYYNNALCSSKNITIPNTINGITIRTIGYAAFGDAGLNAVALPPTLTTIGEFAFDNNNLTSIVLPASVNSVIGTAFSNNNLKSIVIENAGATLEDYCFCGNDNLTLDNISFGGTKKSAWIGSCLH